MTCEWLIYQILQSVANAKLSEVLHETQLKHLALRMHLEQLNRNSLASSCMCLHTREGY